MLTAWKKVILISCDECQKEFHLLKRMRTNCFTTLYSNIMLWSNNTGMGYRPKEKSNK
jgi:hypothetical protein